MVGTAVDSAVDDASPRATPDGAAPRVLDLAGLRALLERLRADGRRVVAPTMRDGDLVHADITSVDDLPRGWSDDQAPGSHRMRPRGDDAVFGYATGAHSWKGVLFPARELLWRGSRTEEAFTAEWPQDDPQPLALVGVRSCDLHAIAIHDRVLLEHAFADDRYAARRRDVFIVAVTCTTPGGTCFCASMGTGPRPDDGFDLELTELLDDAGHRFVVRIGSEAGAELVAALDPPQAGKADLAAADDVARSAAERMGRTLDPTDLRALLYDNAESQQWADVAERCLSCGNCTLVCPTCFCTSVDDVTDLTGASVERWRTWDSCFNADFSYIHGGSVRTSVSSRYRQWMTHKLASWVDQFGTSGCVGCGRCITWCPVGIDITEEARVMRETTRPRAHRRGARHANDG